MGIGVLYASIVSQVFLLLLSNSTMASMNIVPMSGWTYQSPESNRNRLRRYRVTRRTALVRFRMSMSDQNLPQQPGTPNSARVAEALIELPHGVSEFQHAEIAQLIAENVMQNPDAFRNARVSPDDWGDMGLELWIDPELMRPRVDVLEVRMLMTSRDILRAMGMQGSADAVAHAAPRVRPWAPNDLPNLTAFQRQNQFLSGSLRQAFMFGYNEEQKPKHRAIRYMIEGCDMHTLNPLVPQDWIHGSDCNKMCAYNMLASMNTPEGQRKPIKIFRPEEVNRWLNEHGHAVGELTSGLTPDDIQAHAVEFKYGHCAMDLSRSVVNLYIPFDRHKHYRTVCYVVTGDHCQPIIDANIVKSIMQSASARLGRRPLAHVNGQLQQMMMLSSSGSTTRSEERKRRRSLDPIFRPVFERGEDRQHQDQWSTQNSDAIQDMELDPREEEMYGPGDCNQLVTMGQNPKRIQLPLVEEVDRFHFFKKDEDRALIEERCKPTYREGTDAHLIHYYICTDAEDVEFLYQYLVRVLGIDPLRFARSFNGKCRLLKMQNTWWCANPHIHTLLKLHGSLYPKEPFRMAGMATYAFRMLYQEMFQITHKADAIWECMSHYPPNLQRLMDNQHPFNRPKLLQKTYQPPYSNPKDQRPGTGPIQVDTLIPWNQRRRIDMIRSYASTIRLLTDDEYPIHDISNLVVSYDETQHGHIPVGHYLVDIPSEDVLQHRDSAGDAVPAPSHPHRRVDDWTKLPCLPMGASRMMSHRMLRALLHRNLLQKSDIRLVCLTDPKRQKKYGTSLVKALQNMLERIYRHPDLQNESDTKHLINHFVGLCNGTSIPHSGMRYVFHNMTHLYQLLASMVSEEKWQHIKIFHTLGQDEFWKCPFDYYEIDTTGIGHRSFHFQPIYNMVLEDQAINIFDVARTIPLPNLIQINIDAIEYKVEANWKAPLKPAWATHLEEQTVSEEVYKTLTSEQLWRDGYLGRYKQETPKNEERALSYYFTYTQGLHERRIKQFLCLPNAMGTGTIPLDPRYLESAENMEYVPDWKATLKVLVPKDDLLREEWTSQWLADFFTEEHRAGLLLTGPAGTGKTHFIRQLANFAGNMGLRVVRTAYTHAACIQMGADALTLCSLFGFDDKCDNRHRVIMSARFQALMRTMDIDVLIVDEISMIPLSILEVLLLFHRTSHKTRIICVGDFHQLPPVEGQWDRGDDFDYFQATDIFPYLLYDRIRNTPGSWMQLTECRRTQDPLLMRICQNPRAAVEIQALDFPMPPPGIPMWRFISWRNTTRKACNWYCMQRYLQMFPTRTTCHLVLRDLYAERKHKEDQSRNNKRRTIHQSVEPSPAATTTHDLQHYQQQYDRLTYHPPHWKYLQNFTYAEGMEVVCRNTMREWDQNEDPEASSDSPLIRNRDVDTPCVNNRRALLYAIDEEQKTVTLRWMDRLQKASTTLQTIIRTEDNETNETTDTTEASPAHQSITYEASDVVLTWYDFAFNFVPGFCVTAHMIQGETIREHYGILEWQDIVAMKRMAYVTVTRGADSKLLHIVPPYSDPWNSQNDTSQLTMNIIHRLYHRFRWERNQLYNLQVSDIETYLQSKGETVDCDLCHTTPLTLTHYHHRDDKQFMILPRDADAVAPDHFSIVCQKCSLQARSKKAM